MEKEITIQIHDYDPLLGYRIVEDRKATKSEVLDLKKKARESVKVEWDKLPEEARHIVYYAELLDNMDEVCFVAIYMHGEAYGDNDFYRIFTRPGVGYVGAIHKRD